MKQCSCECKCFDSECTCLKTNEQWFIPCEDHFERIRRYANELAWKEKYTHYPYYELLRESFNLLYEDHAYKQLVVDQGLSRKYESKASHYAQEIHKDTPIANLGNFSSIVIVMEKEKGGGFGEPEMKEKKEW
jgi:hypothetical protein